MQFFGKQKKEEKVYPFGITVFIPLVRYGDQ